MENKEKIKETLETEVKDFLKTLYPGRTDYEISSLGEIFGGADTRIISFSFDYQENGTHKSLPLILRVYRIGTSNKQAEWEYNILKGLHGAQKSVPKPYMVSEQENTLGMPYLVMDEIEGVLLATLFDDPEKHNELFLKFISEIPGKIIFIIIYFNTIFFGDEPL